jgi:photosystem II stability/assembly factor-like uncharacterized protein
LCFAYESLGLQPVAAHARGGSTAGAAPTLPTTAIALSPGYGLTDETVFAGVAGAILRSLDGGATWSMTELPAPPPAISWLALSRSFQRDHCAFAGTLDDGVFVSTDGGTHWDRWNFGLVDWHVLGLAVSPNFDQDQTVCVGTVTGVFLSRNGARSWRELAFPMDWAPVISVALSPHFAKDSVLFAGTEAQGLFSSADRGKNWTRLSDFAGEPVNAILLYPDFARRRALLVLAGSTLHSSSDGGNTWQALAVSLPRGQVITCLTAADGIEPNATLLIGLSGGAVMRIGHQISEIDSALEGKCEL